MAVTGGGCIDIDEPWTVGGLPHGLVLSQGSELGGRAGIPAGIYEPPDTLGGGCIGIVVPGCRVEALFQGGGGIDMEEPINGFPQGWFVAEDPGCTVGGFPQGLVLSQGSELGGLMAEF